MRRARSPLVPNRVLEAISSALGVLILLRVSPALAACDNAAPASGQTVTCSSTLTPNPSSTPVVATTGSTNVSANVLPGAELTVNGNNGIQVYDRSTVTNLGTLNITGDNVNGISAQGSVGLDVLTNRGSIVTNGNASVGMFNSAPAVTMLNDTSGSIQTSGTTAHAMADLSTTGGGSLTNNGQLTTTGQGSAGMASFANSDTLVNNGTITTTGAAAAGMLTQGSVGDNVLTNNGTINVSGSASHGIVSEDPLPGVITNTGSIISSGGLGAFIAGKVTFNNAAGASIVSQQSNGIDANGGGTFNNAGTISAQLVTLSFAGGSPTINNSGTIQSLATEAIAMNGPFDVVINNTGTIEGGNGRAIYTDTGNDTLNWSAGTIIGFVRLGTGHDTATLTGLTDTNLAGVPLFAGGNVSSVLNFDNTQASGLSRFTNWSTINATNGSQLTLDNNGLTLGNSGTLTGALSIDSTSTLFAGGLGDPAITPAVSGQLVTVSNAGTIDLTNGGTSTNDALVVNGNYVGLNGKLLLQSVLNGDGSPSDKLVIVQGTGSGKTTLGITNVGGIGAATVTDGIMVVQTTDGATTTASAFTLPKPLVAGAYTYYLFKGGVSAGTADNWYVYAYYHPDRPARRRRHTAPSLRATSGLSTYTALPDGSAGIRGSPRTCARTRPPADRHLPRPRGIAVPAERDRRGTSLMDTHMGRTRHAEQRRRGRSGVQRYAGGHRARPGPLCRRDAGRPARSLRFHSWLCPRPRRRERLCPRLPEPRSGTPFHQRL
jgi:hypothetical protein